MANRYKIATEFTLIDNVTKKLRSMGALGDGAGMALNKSFAAAQERVNNFGRSIANAGKMAAGLATGALVAGVGVATKQFIDFDEAMHGAGAAFSDIDSNAADFTDRLQVIGKAAREVAASTEFDALQAANAMATLARAGVDSQNSIALLPGVADLATAACVQLDEAVGMAVGGLNKMGMMSKDPLILAENMKRLSDVMAYTADSANMSLTDVSEAISQGGDFFKTANNNLNVFSASLTALANNTIAGAEAGVHLRNIMTNLSAPTAKAEKALNELGIQTTDSNGNLLSLTDIVGQFAGALDGMGDAKKNAYLYDIFGKQNLRAINALIDTGADAMRNYEEAASNATGSAASKAAAMRSSIGNQLKVLMSELTELGFKFVEAFQVDGQNLIQSLTTAIHNFANSGALTQIAETIRTIGSIIGSVIQVIWALRGPIIAVTAAVMAYRLVMDGTVLVMTAYKTIVGIVKGAELVMATIKGTATAATIAETAATTAATGAQVGFNAAIAANPIGFIITAIVALIAAIVALVMNWDTVSAKIKEFFGWVAGVAVGIWEGIVGAFKAFGEWIGGVFTGIWETLKAAVGGALDWISEKWAAITSFFTGGGIIQAIRNIGASIFNFIIAPVRKLLELVSNIPGVGKLADKGLDGLDALESMIRGDSAEIANSTPTQTPAGVAEYSKTVTNNNNSSVTIGLAPGLQANNYQLAPEVTIQRTRSGSF